MNFFNFFRRKSQPLRAVAKERVVVTEDAVTRIRPDGVHESVQWADLVEVGIITTDEGPFSEDVFWVLLAADRKSGCAVPQGAEGSDQLLQALQKLPGFDNESLIKAMGSTSNARFVCWRRETQEIART